MRDAASADETDEPMEWALKDRKEGGGGIGGEKNASWREVK